MKAYPLPMRKISIFGPKRMMKDVIEKMYALNYVHIDNYEKDSADQHPVKIDIGTPLEGDDKNSEVLATLSKLIDDLEIERTKINETKKDFSSIKEHTEEIKADIFEIKKERDYLKTIVECIKKKNESKIFSKITKEEKEENKTQITGFIRSSQELNDEFDNEKIECESYFSGHKEATCVLIYCDKTKANKIVEILGKKHFIPVKVKNAKDSKSSRYSIRYPKRIMRDYEDVEKKFRIKSKEHRHFLLSSEKKLQIEYDKLEAPVKFAVSDHTFVVNGWIPEKKEKHIVGILKKITKNKCHIETRKPTKEDNPPIKLQNEGLAKPFEKLIDMYGLPKYKAIDPTSFMFVTFVIFFGFMIGDFFYGLIGFLISLFLLKKFPKAKQLCQILGMSSISGMVFGILLGEYLGITKLVYNGATYVFPHVLSRDKDIITLLSISVLIGFLHVSIGLMFGFVNTLKDKGLKEAVLAKLGMLMLIPGIFAFVANFLKLIKFKSYVVTLPTNIISFITIIFFLGAIFIIVSKILSEGLFAGIIQGLMTIPTTLGGLLSYARIMAIGLAGFYLGIVINDALMPVLSGNILGIVLGVILLITLHLLNVGLSYITSFLHTLRLHYVEYFEKFFIEGGKRYEAFGYKQK